jgi:serine/threonine-protein kinase
MREWADLHPRVALLDLKTRKWRVLMENAADARYVPSGHLVFLRQGTLQAVPFDLRSLEVTGRPVPAIAGIMQALAYVTLHNSAAGQFSISDSGSLIYVSGGIVPDWENELVWVDHQGNVQPDGLPRGSILAPRLSPDGRRIAYNSMGSDYQVWIYDLNRGTSTRLTQEGKSVWPNWTPDGKWVVFGWWESADINLFRQLADGSAPREEITAIEQSTTERESHLPASWSPDGSTLAFVGRNPARTRILMLDLRSHRVTPFLNTRAPEGYPEFSPDGRWLAYVSDESGRSEVYVRSFPQPGGKWQISGEGGGEPLWARSGKQLFYKREDQVWVVDVRTDGGFSPGKPRLLFEKPGYGFGDPIRDWDISLDGRQFLMLKLQEMKPQPVTEMILVQNWFEELKRLAPTGRK